MAIFLLCRLVHRRQNRSTAPVLVRLVMFQPFMMMGRDPIAVMTDPPVAIVPYVMAIPVADDHRWTGAVVASSGIIVFFKTCLPGECSESKQT